MVQYLRKIFPHVTDAENGKEGLEKYIKEKFDLVITDLSMPVMDGAVMLGEIKKINKNQTVLITSAHIETSNFFDLSKINVDGYIVKPFEWHQLNSELQKVVEKIHKKN